MVGDIRIKTSFPWHRKVRRLTRELGQDCTGYLLRLFVRTAMTRPDGCLRDMDAVDIACDAEWDGDPQTFLDALILCGWIDQGSGGVLWLHDWPEHQPWVVNEPARRAAGRKGASARWNRPDGDGDSDGSGVGGHGPDVRKMPEVGSEPGESMRTACASHANGMRIACAPHAQGMRTAMPLSFPYPKGIKTPPVASSEATSPVGGQTQARKRFVPPSVNEVAAYCAERGNGLDAQAIHDHYTANGWKVGKNPMKDWRAAVRTWEARAKDVQHKRTSLRADTPAARLMTETAGGKAQ